MNRTDDPDVFMREGRTNNSRGGPRPRFTLVPFDDLRPGTGRQYLIKGMIPRHGITVVWGPPKCGKSFWCFDAVMHVAMGWEYRGRRIHPGPVVYCAFEGAEGFNARAEAFRQRHELEGQMVPFHMIAAATDLVRDHSELTAAIKVQIGDIMPAVVVLDTLNRSLRGSESSDQDMAEYVRAADAIHESFQCAVVVVHHCGHGGTRPRGHSALLGALYAQIAVARNAAGNIIVTVEEMKDGASGDTVASRLEQVTVGTDEDGDAITSCVVVAVDECYIVKPTTSRKLSGKQRLALDCLTDLVIDGKPLPAEWKMGIGIKAVPAFEWRAEIERRGILDPESTNPRARWQELKTALMARDSVRERDGLVWKL